MVQETVEDKDTNLALQLRLLGSPQVKQDDHVLVIQRRKVQALLFYLAVSGEDHQRATLAALFWPESDQQQAYGSLRRHLSALNQALGRGWVKTEQDTVRLSPDRGLWIDVHEFGRLLAECRQHGHPADVVCARCINPLRSTVALYRGHFLAGFTLADAPDFDEWQRFQVEDLRFAYATALERLVETYQLDQGMTAADAIPFARLRLSLDPLHEPMQRRLMRLYVASGQQAAALRQYERCAQTLQRELDVAPSAETVALYEQIRRGDLTPATSVKPAGDASDRDSGHNLPASTTAFVGRSAEVAELLNLCRQPERRLVTVLGPGGIGKTRLSLEAAAQLVDETPQGVYFVRLAQLSDPADIAATIADALKLQFQTDGRDGKEQLCAYLAQRQLLLLLDNFEHLLDGVGFVQELLQRAPGLRLLITSRERLKLTGETVYVLNSLNFPTWETPQNLQRFEAIQLFAETAQRVRPNIAFQDDDMQHVARICRIVGGMPLGIILAATWMAHLSPATIAAELTRGFDLLESELVDLPERQRSMRAILAYSWRQLTAEEQAVFMRLSLFRGGFTRDAALAVAGASLPALVRLVDRSFVQPVGEERYDVHELLRQYAQQRLETAGNYAGTLEAHGLYFLDFLHHAERRMAGSEQLTAIHQIEADFENIRAAWQWAVTASRDDLIDHAIDGLFRWFWLRRSRQQEGLSLLRLAHEQWAPETGESPQPIWGRILARMVEQPGPWLGDPIAVQGQVGQALEIARQHQNQEEVIFCTWMRSLAIVSQHRLGPSEEELQPAIRDYAASVAAYRSSGDHFWLAQALELLGHSYRQLERYDRAMEVLHESLALRRAQGDRFGLARSYREIAWAGLYRGMESETLEAAEAACALQLELGDQQGIADSRFFLALALLCRGECQRAKLLLGPVRQFAAEMDNAIYRRWSSSAFKIAICMEEYTANRQSTADDPFVRFRAFAARLMSVTFSLREARAIESTIPYRQNFRKLLLLATTDLEMAVCLLFAADLLALEGDSVRAIQLLALADRHSAFSGSWVGLHPAIISLQPSLRDRLSHGEYERVWTEGCRQDLHVTVAELLVVDE